jgi:hypothetical protein
MSQVFMDGCLMMSKNTKRRPTPFVREVGACNGCNRSQVGTGAQEGFQFCNGRHITLHDALDGSFIGIGYPTTEVKTVGMVEDESAEANTLNGAFNEKVDAGHAVR